jgi:DNA-binding MarR family transcriptional regulator
MMPQVRLNDGSSIAVEAETWSIENEEGKVLASLTQIPLRLAWAITIHKSQGMTLESAEIDLARTFENGQGYVALSRLKSIEGLKLLDFNPQALVLDRLAVKADARFKELSDEAEQHFAELDLSKQHEAFIRRTGGITNPNEIARLEKKLQGQKRSYSSDTLAETQALYEADYDIEDIASERQLTKSTVINHLSKLAKAGSIDVERIRPEEDELERVRKAYKKIQKRNQADDLNDDGSVKLRPLVSETGLGYEQVRVALIFVA